MSKGAAAIAIIALIVSFGASGYLAYQTLQPAGLSPIESMYILEKIIPPSGVVNTWYGYSTNIRGLDYQPGGYDLDISIDFDVSAGELVSISYTGWAYLVLSTPGTQGTIRVRLNIDGFDYTLPQIWVNTNATGSYVSISLQNVTYLSPGHHNISVYYGSSNLNIGSTWVGSRCLIIQTLIP